MIRKLLICPYFGPLPEWMPFWEDNAARALEPHGYDLLHIDDLGWFKDRVLRTFVLDAPVVAGEGKIHDYRCAFGEIFSEEIEDYDFWGHTDFDCVYGRVDHFLPDSLLDSLDLFSNHPTYVSGPWSLYRNTPAVNSLFREVEDWRGHLENPSTTGWVETSFSRAVEASGIRYRYENWQSYTANGLAATRFDGDRLMEGNREIMIAHFKKDQAVPGGVQVTLCICGAPAQQNHHVVYKQHVRRRGGDPGDDRNFLPLCYDHHRRHHNRVEVIPLTVIPEAALEFARELLGDAVQDYFRRYYRTPPSGEDPSPR